MTGIFPGITFGGDAEKSADRRGAPAHHPGTDIFKWHFEDCLIPANGRRPHAGIGADGFPEMLDMRDLLSDGGSNPNSLDSLIDFQREAARDTGPSARIRGQAGGIGHAEYAGIGLYGIDRGFVAGLLSTGKGMVDG